MGASQTALSNSATAMGNALNNSTLDWRVALVTTDYSLNAVDCPSGSTANTCTAGFRHFTTSIPQFQKWLTRPIAPAVNADWIGLSGSGAEMSMRAAAKAVHGVYPVAADDPLKVREGASLVIVVLGDADDQSGMPSPNNNVTAANAEYVKFFTTANASITINRQGSGGSVDAYVYQRLWRGDSRARHRMSTWVVAVTEKRSRIRAAILR